MRTGMGRDRSGCAAFCKALNLSICFYEFRTIIYAITLLQVLHQCLQAHSALVYNKKEANSELLRNFVLYIRPSIAPTAQVAQGEGHQEPTFYPWQQLRAEAGMRSCCSRMGILTGQKGKNLPSLSFSRKRFSSLSMEDLNNSTKELRFFFDQETLKGAIFLNHIFRSSVIRISVQTKCHIKKRNNQNY